jgi:hypothetical protein
VTLAALAALAALGVFASVPLVGEAATGHLRSPGVGWVRFLPLVVAAGMTLWSVPMLGSAALGIHSPALLGAVGWVTVAWWIAAGRWRHIPSVRRPDRWTALLGVGLLLAFLVYAALPADPLITGRDMGVYAAHGAWIADHGRLDVPYADGALTAADGLPPGWVGYAGVYPTMPTQTVQFGHVYPTWLAQAYAAGGFGLLLRVNAALATIAALAVFGVARRWVPAPIAILATMVLAFNASQVWVARTTLSETMTQLFIWAAFLLLVGRGRGRSSLAWAGVFIGMASIVRIDSLVMVPLFLGGMAVAGCVGADARARAEGRWFLAVALPMSLLAVALYAVLTRPYFGDLGPELRLIGLASLAAALVYAATLARPVRRVVRHVITSKPFLLVASVVVVIASGYAYFVRPDLEPFARIDAPGHPLDGIRSHVEDAMRNLGAYVGPPTVWLAVGGWTGLMVLAIRRRPAWIPVLVVMGGYSALYFWNQSIFPDHFWAVRRFVPIVIPAALVLAGWAGGQILLRLPPRLRPLLVVLAAILLAAQTWRAGTPLFFVAERQGTYGTLASVVEDTPEGVSLLGVFTANGIKAFGTPLALVFDRHVLAIDAWRAEGRAEVLSRLASATPASPLIVFSNQPQDVAMLEGTTLAEESLSYSTILSTTNPVPSEVRESSFTMLTRAVTGVDTRGVAFGGRPTWIASDEGFHGVEHIEGSPARWTTDLARITVPVLGGPVTGIVLDLVAAGPEGSEIRVLANDVLLGAITVPEEGWQGEFDLPQLVEAGTDIQVAIESSTFVPAEHNAGSTDVRRLGVLLRSIRLLGP